jgi:hypothetical protein
MIMFEKIGKWIMNSTLLQLVLSVILIGCLISATLYTQKEWNLVNLNNNPPELKEFKGGVQNRLVWDIEGTCYFVRPFTDKTVYLVSVPDCNRK